MSHGTYGFLCFRADYFSSFIDVQKILHYHYSLIVESPSARTLYIKLTIIYMFIKLIITYLLKSEILMK